MMRIGAPHRPRCVPGTLYWESKPITLLTRATLTELNGMIPLKFSQMN